MSPDKIVQQLIPIVRQAGDILRKHFLDANLEVTQKGDRDIVTKADYEADAYLADKLQKLFPDIEYISEENNEDLEYGKSLTNCWVVDPLDGTQAFQVGEPDFCISVGYIDKRGEMHGCVYHPILNHIYYTKNNKAYMNDHQIKVSDFTNLSRANVRYWDKRERDLSWDKVGIHDALYGKVLTLRIAGSGVMGKARVASGQIHLYIANTSSIWGAVANVALIRNAGGICLNLAGEEWDLGDIGIICGNKTIATKAFQELKIDKK